MVWPADSGGHTSKQIDIHGHKTCRFMWLRDIHGPKNSNKGLTLDPRGLPGFCFDGEIPAGSGGRKLHVC